MAKKKLREVTLGEANKICEKHDLNCLNCPLHNKQWSECSVVVFNELNEKELNKEVEVEQ